MIENLLQFLIGTVFGIIIFLLTWCMHIQNNGITPATSENTHTHTHRFLEDIFPDVIKFTK